MTVTSLDLPLLQAIGIDGTAHPAVEAVSELVAVWAIAAVPVSLVVLWLSGDPKTRLASVAAAMSATLGLLFAGVLSWTFYEPRPFTEGVSPNVLHHVADSSFPSDHVTVIAAVAVSLALGQHPRLAIALGVVAVSVALARVALGVHYPSDVVGGALLGSTSALILRAPPLDHLARFTAGIAEWIGGRLRLDLFALGPVDRHDGRR